MTEVTKRVSKVLAHYLSRRDFLSTLLRGGESIGIGAGLLYGTILPARADGNCYGVAWDEISGSTCGGLQECVDGDSVGCRTAPTPDCLGCQNDGLTCPSGYTDMGWWTCCCNGNRLSTCTDCWQVGEGFCRCVHVGDPQLGC